LPATITSLLFTSTYTAVVIHSNSRQCRSSSTAMHTGGAERMRARRQRAYMRVEGWILLSCQICQPLLSNCWSLFFLFLSKK
jgi:predicted anti-sigma-YlaC factor YlaD